jgi:hypothetical protein
MDAIMVVVRVLLAISVWRKRGGGSWHCLVEMIGALKAVSFGMEMEGGGHLCLVETED